MKKQIHKLFSMLLACALFFSMLPPVNVHAQTLADKATGTVKFGEYEQIEFIKNEIVTLKILMTEKGTFCLDFASYKVDVDVQLYDESNNLLGEYTGYSDLSKITPSTVGYKEDLEPGTYYINLWVTSMYDEGTYTYFARQIPSKKTSLEICINLKKGRTLQLGTIFSNVKNKSVTWRSSNKKVATVTTKGKVTAVKKGTATIKVYNKSGLLARIKIKVVE